MNIKPLYLFIIFLFGVAMAGDIGFQSSVRLSPKANEIAERMEWGFLPDHALCMDACYDMGRDFYAHIELQRQSGIGDWFAGGYYLGSTSKSSEGRGGFYFPYGNSRLMVGMTLVDQQVFPLIGVDYTQREWQVYLQLSSRFEMGLSYAWGAAEKSLSSVFHILTPTNAMKTNLSEIVVRGYYLDNGNILINGKSLSLRADGLFSEKVALPTWGKTTIHIQIQGTVIPEYETSLTVIRTPPYWDVSESKQLKWVSILDKMGKVPNLLQPTENVSRGEFSSAMGRLLDRDIQKGTHPLLKLNSMIIRKDAYLLLNRFLPPKMKLILTDAPKENVSRMEMMDLLANWYPLAIIPSVDNVVTPDASDVAENTTFGIPLNEQTARVLGPIAVIRKVLSVEKAPPMLKDLSTQQDDVMLLTSTKLTTVHSAVFWVKGKGPAGLKVRVANHVLTIPQSGVFSVKLSLNPGLNTVGVAAPSMDKKIITVIYQKNYKDLPQKDMFTPFYEKMGTLGYFKTDERFEPFKVLSKRDFYEALIKAGYGSRDDLETLGPLDQRMSYKQAIEIMQKMAGRSLSRDSSAAGDLTRRMFALLLYELPKVKADIQKKFPDAS